jgi:hypothetical protein
VLGLDLPVIVAQIFVGLQADKTHRGSGGGERRQVGGHHPGIPGARAVPGMEDLAGTRIQDEGVRVLVGDHQPVVPPIVDPSSAHGIPAIAGLPVPQLMQGCKADIGFGQRDADRSHVLVMGGAPRAHLFVEVGHPLRQREAALPLFARLRAQFAKPGELRPDVFEGIHVSACPGKRRRLGDKSCGAKTAFCYI